MADEQDFLFPPSLLPESVFSQVPHGYTLRPLSRTDDTKGFFSCLQSLTWTGDISSQQFQDQFDWMKTKGAEWFYDLVVEHEGKIVATGVLLVERKLYVLVVQPQTMDRTVADASCSSIWGLGKTGHIEDIAVRSDYQGKGLGKIIVTALDELARVLNVNKTMLDCSVENEAFYRRCGFELESGIHMGHKLGRTAEDGPP